MRKRTAIFVRTHFARAQPFAWIFTVVNFFDSFLRRVYLDNADHVQSMFAYVFATGFDYDGD